MDRIRISGLKIFAHHGVYEEEKVRGQTFDINAVLYMNMEKAGKSDELSDAVDYGAVCLFIDSYMRENHFNLLEALAEHMARALLLQYPEIEKIDLEIEKPDAPIPLRFETVSVRIVRSWHKVYIAMGSNMGERLRYLEKAVAHLLEDEQFRNIKVSEYLESEPYGNVEQAKFLNGVLEAETLYSPQALLERLRQEENLAGRERLIHWGPRTLDLDILFYDELVLNNSSLTIPHPDMKNRLFVLEPLFELNPYLIHPVYKKTVEELLRELKKA